MSSRSDPHGFEKILDLFARHCVEFIVIGGQAELIHGGARVTYDVDLCYRRTAENLEHLAAALIELQPTLRGAPPDLPFTLDARALALGSNFTFETSLVPLDLLGWVEPLGTYEELLIRAETYRYKQHEIKVIALDDLIRVKEHIQRPKDRESLMHLRAIKQIREQGT